MSTDQPTESAPQPTPSKLQLENQSLKRRLVQYAATLEKLTTHAKREIDQSTRARDEALSRAADASALRQRLSVMHTSLTSAEAARDTAAAARRRAEARVEQLLATLASLQRRLDDARYDDTHVASMREELASLQKELPSLRRMREQDAARATTLSEQLEQEKQKSASSESLILKLQQLQMHNSQLLTDRDAAQLTVSNMRRSESSLTREREDLSVKLRESDDMNDMLRQQLHQMQDRLRLLEQRIKDAQHVEIRYQNDLTDSKKQADDAVAALRTELDSVLKDLGERNTLYEELQQKHARSVDAESAIAERDSMRANIRQLQLELDQSTEMLTRAAIDALADKGKIRKLEDALGKVRSDMDGERKQRASSQVKIAALNQQMTSLETEMDQLRASKRQLADECHKYQLQIHERDSIVASKNRALDELDTDRNDRAFQVDRLKLELSNTKNGLVKKEADLVKITTDYEEMCSVVRSTNKDLDTKHAEVNSLRKDIAAATDQTNKLVQERNQLKATVSELQTARGKAEELSNLLAAKEEELASMKRWCTTLKAEAGESVREKKRLSDMLSDVSGDLKRANQELELLRNMRQEQETLAHRISQISETSTRELSIMRQSQTEQAQVLAKNTVEQYQRRLAEMQKSARHEIAETVSCQLRDDIMPHLMRAVDTKARHLVHALAKHVESFTLDDAAASYPSTTRDSAVPKPSVESQAASAVETRAAPAPPSAPQSTSHSLFMKSTLESTTGIASQGGAVYEYTGTEAVAGPSAVTSERSAEALREVADTSIATGAVGTDEELAADIDPVAIHNRLTESYKELLGDHSITDPTQTEGFREINTEANMDNVSELVQVKATSRQVTSSFEASTNQEPVAEDAVPLETPVPLESAEAPAAEALEAEDAVPLEALAAPMVETSDLSGEKPEAPAEEVVHVEDAVPLETAAPVESREIPVTMGDAPPEHDESKEEETTPLEAPVTFESAETPVEVTGAPEDDEPIEEEDVPLETAAAGESKGVPETAPDEEVSNDEEPLPAEASPVVESREIPSLTMEDLHTAPVDLPEGTRDDEVGDVEEDELEIVQSYIPRDGDLDESLEEPEEDEGEPGEEAAYAEDFQDALDAEASLGGEVVSQEPKEEIFEDAIPFGDDSKEEGDVEASEDASPLGRDTVEEGKEEERDQGDEVPRDVALTPEDDDYGTPVEDASPLGGDTAVNDIVVAETKPGEAPLEGESEGEDQDQEALGYATPQSDGVGAGDYQEEAALDDASPSSNVDENEAPEEAVTAERDFAVDDVVEGEALVAATPSPDAPLTADQEEDDVAVDAAPLDVDVGDEEQGGEEVLHGDTEEFDEEGTHDHDEEDSAADAAPLDDVADVRGEVEEEEAFASLDVDPVGKGIGEDEPTIESPPLGDDTAADDNGDDYAIDPLEHVAGPGDSVEDSKETPLTVPIVSADLGDATGRAVATDVQEDTASEDIGEAHDREFDIATPEDHEEDDQGGVVQKPASEQILLGSTEDAENDAVDDEMDDHDPQQATGDVLEVDAERNLLSDPEVVDMTDDATDNIAGGDEADEDLQEEGMPTMGIPGLPEDTSAQETVGIAQHDPSPVIAVEPLEHHLDLGAAADPASGEAAVNTEQMGELQEEVEEQIAVPETQGIRDGEDPDEEEVTETTREFLSGADSKDMSEAVAEVSEDKQDLLDLTAEYGVSTSEALGTTAAVLPEETHAQTDTAVHHEPQIEQYTAEVETHAENISQTTSEDAPPLAAQLEEVEDEDNVDYGTGRQDVARSDAAPNTHDAEGEAEERDIELLAGDVQTSQGKDPEQESTPSPLVGADAAVVEGDEGERADNEYIEEVDATREDYGAEQDFEAEPPVVTFATLHVVEGDDDEDDDDEDDDDDDYEDEEEDGELSGQAPVEGGVGDEVEELDLTGRPADLDAHSDLDEADYEGIVDPAGVYGPAIVQQLSDGEPVDLEPSPIAMGEAVPPETVLAANVPIGAVRQDPDVVTEMYDYGVNQPVPVVPLGEGVVRDDSKDSAPQIAVDEAAIDEQVPPMPSIPAPGERVGNVTTAGVETAADTVDGENILRA